MGKQEEERYYPKVKKALENHFQNKGFSVDFKVTGRKRSLVRQFLPENSNLLRDVRSLPTPDIMGFIWRQPQQKRKLVIAEFKLRPTFMDIFQVKGYDELFNPDCTFLLSLEPLLESSRFTIDYIRDNTDLLKMKRDKPEIDICFLYKIREGIFTLAKRGDETDLPFADIDLLFSEDE